MKQFVSVTTVLACVFIYSVSVHGIHVLGVTGTADKVQLAGIGERQLLRVLSSERFWSSYPPPPLNFQVFLNVQVAFVVMALMVCLLQIIRNQKKLSYMTRGMFCLLFGLVPYVVGQ